MDPIQQVKMIDMIIKYTYILFKPFKVLLVMGTSHKICYHIIMLYMKFIPYIIYEIFKMLSSRLIDENAVDQYNGCSYSH